MLGLASFCACGVVTPNKAMQQRGFGDGGGDAAAPAGTKWCSSGSGSSVASQGATATAAAVVVWTEIGNIYVHIYGFRMESINRK